MAHDIPKKPDESTAADAALDKLVADEPPHPRDAGSSAPKKVTDNEDKLVSQIEAQDKSDALDDLYDQESTPEEPMLVLGDEKHPRLAALKRPKFWILLFLALLTVVIFAWLITPSRTWLLNTLGLRGTLDFTTVVSTTEGTPPVLKNATIAINGRDYHTDDKGALHLSLPYGPLHIVVSKQGYDTITKDQTLDFDPFFNKLGGQAADNAVRRQQFALTNVGVVVTFTAQDWLTGLPLTTGTFSVGDVAATPPADGVVTLALPATDAKTVQVTAKFTGNYADTMVEVPVGSTKPPLTFIPAGKDYFLSKRSGQYAVYSANIDGSGVAEIIPAASAETGDVSFSVSPNGKFGVLASTREATRDTFGSVQQKLYLVDLAGNKLTALDTALVFKAVDWAGDTVVYTAQSHDTSGGLTQRLASFDVAAQKQTTLATAAGFTVVRVRLGSAVYLLGTGELRTVKIKGGTEKSLGTGITNLTQTDADHFAFQTADQSWHQYDVNADQIGTAATPTAPARAFLATTSADGQTQLVIDRVDGKPTLLAKNVGNGKEVPLYAGLDLGAPIRWVGNVAVYRAGSADYVASPLGGQPKKITDVSPTLTAKNDYLTFN